MARQQYMQSKVMKWGCVLLSILGLCGCSFDPYNALIWNRENVIRNSGVVDTQPWFEWWYYKLVLPESGDAFYFIYGVVNPWDTAMENPSSRAYVGMGNFAEKAIIEDAYPVSDFSASYRATDVRVQNQHATDESIVGSLVDGDGGQVSWDIQISKRWNFNAMGWAMFVPEITNIFWYPAQADALFTGRINYKGQVYTFENAPGYQDRNWGRSFPEWWVWIVSNHFEGHPNTALAVGGGKPVILDAIDAFEGVGIGLFHKGKEYAFRPSDLDLVQVNIRFGTWKVEAINTEGCRITIEASAPCDSFTDIMFVTPQGEVFHDFETLTGELTVRLYERSAGWNSEWRLTETLWSDFAGIEYGHRDLDLFDCFASESKLLYSNF
jgi:tocopherol cyclase